jgi:hypothetical protein
LYINWLTVKLQCIIINEWGKLQALDKYGGADRDRTDDLLNAIRKKGILQVLENTELSLPNNGLTQFFICL